MPGIGKIRLVTRVSVISLLVCLGVGGGCGKQGRQRSGAAGEAKQVTPAPTRITGALVQRLLGYPEGLTASQREASTGERKQVGGDILWVRTFTSTKDKYRPLTMYACRKRCRGKLFALPDTRCHTVAGRPRHQICQVGLFLGGLVSYARLPSPKGRFELLVLAEHPTRDVAVTPAARKYFQSFDHRVRLASLTRELAKLLWKR